MSRVVNLKTVRFSIFESWYSEWYEREFYQQALFEDLNIRSFFSGLFYRLRIPTNYLYIKRFVSNNILLSTDFYFYRFFKRNKLKYFFIEQIKYYLFLLKKYFFFNRYYVLRSLLLTKSANVYSAINNINLLDNFEVLFNFLEYKCRRYVGIVSNYLHLTLNSTVYFKTILLKNNNTTSVTDIEQYIKFSDLYRTFYVNYIENLYSHVIIYKSRLQLLREINKWLKVNNKYTNFKLRFLRNQVVQKRIFYYLYFRKKENVIFSKKVVLEYTQFLIKLLYLFNNFNFIEPLVLKCYTPKNLMSYSYCMHMENNTIIHNNHYGIEIITALFYFSLQKKLILRSLGLFTSYVILCSWILTYLVPIVYICLTSTFLVKYSIKCIEYLFKYLILNKITYKVFKIETPYVYNWFSGCFSIRSVLSDYESNTFSVFKRIINDIKLITPFSTLRSVRKLNVRLFSRLNKRWLFRKFYNTVFSTFIYKIEQTIQSYVKKNVWLCTNIFYKESDTLFPPITNAKIIVDYVVLRSYQGKSLPRVFYELKLWQLSNYEMRRVIEYNAFLGQLSGFPTEMLDHLSYKWYPVIGMRIECSGTTKKGRRKRKIYYGDYISNTILFNKSPNNTYSADLDYYQSFVILKSASIGVKVWIFFKTHLYNANNKFISLLAYT